VSLPVVIDTDPGNGIPGSDIDDALAIAVALLSPEVHLLGLTTVAGNVEVGDATACALHLLEVAGRTDIPVCEGAASPLVADPAPIRSGIRARESSELAARLWRGVRRPAPRHGQDRRHAAEFLIETVMARPGEVTVVPIGPLTNIATAMRVEPRLASAVKGIVWMGGAVRTPGTLTPATELNASYDPEATHIVLSSGAPITIVGLDVTKRTCLTPGDVGQIRAIGTPLSDYLAEVVEPWVRFVMERRHLPGCWLHDPLAVCVAIDPAIVRTEPMYVRVELASPVFRGQTVGWDAHFPYLFAAASPNAKVCLEVDNARFMSRFLGALGARG
jgi:inosine-uridine nucleoside N-ribohydrolase